jgi:hypothetical protein
MLLLFDFKLELVSQVAGHGVEEKAVYDPNRYKAEALAPIEHISSQELRSTSLTNRQRTNALDDNSQVLSKRQKR